MNYKIILGIIAVVLGLIGYVPYFKDIFFGQTKPHVFSWFIWALLEGIVFFAQISRGAGAGAWITGVTSILCICVFLVSLSKGGKNFTLLDKLSLVGALSGIIFWLLTKNAAFAVVLVSLADFLGFVPTFRKSYFKPEEETVKLYFMSFLKSVFAILALQAYNVTTVTYLVYLALANLAFVVMALIRRRSLKILNG